MAEFDPFAEDTQVVDQQTQPAAEEFDPFSADEVDSGYKYILGDEDSWFSLVQDPNTGGYGIEVPDFNLDFLKLDAPDEDKTPDELTATESLRNSWNNALDQISLTDDRFYHLSEQLFGDTDSLTFQEADLRIAETEAAQQEAGGTLALEDIPDAFEEEGFIGGLAHTGAAVANAVSAFGASAIQAYATFGAGLAVDMVQGSVQDYTRQRAEEEGISYEEAAGTLGAETIIPIGLGALSYKFEKFGLKGVGNAIKGLGPGAKKALFQTINAAGKEGGTELAQGVVEAFNRGLGAKQSLDEAAGEVKKFWEEEALETFLQGAVGGGVSAGGGRALSRAASQLRSNSAERTIAENAQKIFDIDQRLNDPNTDDATKKVLNRARTRLRNEIKKAIVEPNKDVRKLTDEQIDKVNKRGEKINKLHDELKESREFLDDDAYRVLEEDINGRIQDEIDGINNIYAERSTTNIRTEDGTLYGNEIVNQIFEGKQKGEISDAEAATVAYEYEGLARSVAKKLFRAHPEFKEQAIDFEEFVSQLQFGYAGNEASSLLGLAKTYEPGKGSFGGYAERFLKERGKRVLDKNVKQATTAAKTVGTGEGEVDVAYTQETTLDKPVQKIRSIAKKLGFSREAAEQFKERVSKVLTSKKLNTATKAGFGKALSKAAREELASTIREELGKKDDYFRNLNNNWKNYLSIIPKTAISKVRHDSALGNWAETPPTKEEFVNYFRGVDIDAGDTTQTQKTNAKAARKLSLARWISDGLFSEAAADLLASDPTIQKQFEVVNALKEGDAIDSINAARIVLINKTPISESRLLGPEGGKVHVGDDITPADSITSILQQAWQATGHNIKSTTSRVAAIGALVEYGLQPDFASAKRYIEGINGFTFRTPSGLNFIYNNKDLGVATPIHEMGHVWSSWVLNNNPKLWAELVTQIVKDRNILIRESERLRFSSYYSKFGDNARNFVTALYNQPDRAADMIKKAVGTKGLWDSDTIGIIQALDEIVAGAVENHGAARIGGETTSALDRLIKQFWDIVEKLIGSVENKIVSELTIGEVLDLAVNDILTGKPGSSFVTMDIPVGNYTFESAQADYRQNLTRDQRQDQAISDAIDILDKDKSNAGINKAWEVVSEFMTKDHFLDWIIQESKKNPINLQALQAGLIEGDIDSGSVEKAWQELAGGKLTLLQGRPAKAWQNDQAKIDEKFDKNFEFFSKHEQAFTQALPKEFWLTLSTLKKDGTQQKASILRQADAEYFASKAKESGLKFDNTDAFGRIENAGKKVANLQKLANSKEYQQEVAENQEALFAIGDAIQQMAENGVPKEVLGSFIKSFTNTGIGTTNFFRKAPQLAGYVEGIEKATKRIPEHNPPAGYIAQFIFENAVNGNFDQRAKDAIKDKFKYYLVPPSYDPGVHGQGPTSLKAGITKGFDLRRDNPLVRYAVTGADVTAFRDIDGNPLFEGTQDFNKAQKDAVNTTVGIENGGIFENRKQKGQLSAFDFDDTLAETANKVIVMHSDGSKSVLDSEQFATFQPAKGDKLDFSDFDNVNVKKVLPAFDKLKAALDRGDDVVILTARTMKAGKDVRKFLRDQLGDKADLIKFKGVGHSSPIAKANYLENAVAKYGYKSVYFIDDSEKNINAIKKVLGDKAKVELAGIEVKNKETFVKAINNVFNNILRKAPGKTSKFTLPPNAEDFKGLLYSLLPSGDAGKKALEFFDKTLIKPYWQGVANATEERRARVNTWNTLTKKLKKENGIKINDSIPGTNDNFTYGDAIIARRLKQEGKPTGLNKQTQQILEKALQENSYLGKLANIVNNAYELELDADNIGKPINHQILKAIDKGIRSKHLKTFSDNVDIIFSKDNLQKLEDQYGREYVAALENMLKRMKAGRNRLSAEPVNPFLKWAQRAVSTTLAWNVRSGLLQLLSTVNYIGLPGNTFGSALGAVTNVGQYRKDIQFLKNSPYIKDRQETSKFDVLAEEVAGRGGQSWQDRVFSHKWGGFSVTKWGDRNAIAYGGATFYRNRLNQLKKEGLSEKEAQKQAYQEFVEYSESAQQSADPANISQIQSTDTGKLFFAFANTPFQYARKAKRAVQDVVKGRSKNVKQDIGTAIYYTGLQTAIFTALQSGLAFALFDDDEDVKEDKFWVSLERGLTGLLKSMGYGGAGAATGLSIAAEIGRQQSGYSRKDPMRVAQAFLSASPPVSIKFGDVISGTKAIQRGEYVKGAAEWTAFTTGQPADRVFKKINNILDILTEDMDTLERIARFGGWSEWDFVSFKQGSKKKKSDKPFDPFTEGGGEFDPFSEDNDEWSPFDRDEAGQILNDGTIQVDPNLSPLEREKTIKHEMEHLRQMQEDGLDYDDNYVYYKGNKHMRRNGKIRYNGRWHEEGGKGLPWEAEAYKAE